MPREPQSLRGNMNPIRMSASGPLIVRMKKKLHLQKMSKRRLSLKRRKKMTKTSKEFQAFG